MILVSNDAANAFSNCLIGVPCTSQEKKALPTHITTLIDGTYSTIMAENVMSVNANRLTGYIGVVDDELMTRIEDILSIALGLKEVERKDYAEEKVNMILDIPAIDVPLENTVEDTSEVKNEEPPTITTKRGRPAPTKDDMTRFLDDYATHDIDYMIKNYNVTNKQAAALRAARYRKKLAEVS